MCGRYRRLTAKERYIRDHFGLDDDPPWTPRWNIAPTQQIATIRQHRSEPKRIFGLMPGPHSLLGKGTVHRSEDDQRDVGNRG